MGQIQGKNNSELNQYNQSRNEVMVNMMKRAHNYHEQHPSFPSQNDDNDDKVVQNQSLYGSIKVMNQSNVLITQSDLNESQNQKSELKQSTGVKIAQKSSLGGLKQVPIQSVQKKHQNQNSQSILNQSVNQMEKKQEITQISTKNIQIQKISIQQFDFQQRLFQLPNKVISRILRFVLNQYKQLTLVSPIWYYKIHEVFEEDLIELDNKFIKKYQSFLMFRTSYLSYNQIYVSKKKGFRLDRHIVAEILPVYKNKSITIAFTFKSYDQKKMFTTNEKPENKKSQNYFFEYKFDVIDSSTRNIWMYKEDCRHNFDQNKLAFIQPILPVQVGDNIKLIINFYNLSGLIDIDSIQWRSPKFSHVPHIPIQIDPNDIQKYDKTRICEIEEIYTSWILFEYFQKDEKIQYDLFQPQLELVETRCAGVDIVTSKHIYIAKQPGEIEKSLEILGAKIKVLDKKSELTVEVKKMGLFKDLDNSLQLRVGDILIFYISKGD